MTIKISIEYAVIAKKHIITIKIILSNNQYKIGVKVGYSFLGSSKSLQKNSKSVRLVPSNQN